MIFENGYFRLRHPLILFYFKSVQSLRSLLYFMLSRVERIGYHLDFTETAELCYQMLKPVGAAPGKQVQVLKGLSGKCSSAQIEEFPWRLSQGSLSSNFRTSLSYFKQANLTQSLLWGMQGKLRSKCFMAVLALGVRRRCIYVALAGKPGCQVGPGPGWPRDTTNLPQQPSWIPFLLTLFLFPPHFISLSSSLYFSFLLAFFCLTLAKFLVLRRRVTRQQLTRKGQEGKDSSWGQWLSKEQAMIGSFELCICLLRILYLPPPTTCSSPRITQQSRAVFCSGYEDKSTQNCQSLDYYRRILSKKYGVCGARNEGRKFLFITDLWFQKLVK